MKRTCWGHTKLRRLQRRMNEPMRACVGLLEMLWHLSARETPRGDIGRLTDDDIADHLGWEKDPADLIAMLTECGWVDHDEEHRLVIHDWHEHADEAVRKQLQRAGQTFVNAGAVRKRAPKAEDGGGSQQVADNGGQRRTTADNGCLPKPEPKPCTPPPTPPTPSQGCKTPGGRVGNEPPAEMPDGTRRLTDEQSAVLEQVISDCCRAQTMAPEVHRRFRLIFSDPAMTPSWFRSLCTDAAEAKGGRVGGPAYLAAVCENALSAEVQRPKPAPDDEDDVPEHVRYFRRPSQGMCRTIGWAWIDALVEGQGDPEECERNLRALWTNCPPKEAEAGFDYYRRWVLEIAADRLATLQPTAH